MLLVIVLLWPGSPRAPSDHSANAGYHTGSAPGVGTQGPRTQSVPTTTLAPTEGSPQSVFGGGQGTDTDAGTGAARTGPEQPSMQVAPPGEQAAITAGVVDPPGPLGEVFVTASDSSYAAVEFGGSQPGFILMSEQNGTWTEIDQGFPQIPCATSQEYGLPLGVKSDLAASGYMQLCG